MRQRTTTILLIFLVLIMFSQPAFCAIKGGIKYSIPVEYNNLSETELKDKADYYYYLATQLKDGKINDDMTNALMIYSVLQNMNPENVLYSIRLGILYGKVKADRYAKGNLSRAISISPKNPEPYFYMGEFYYERKLYKNALKYYKKAFECSSTPTYELLYKLGDIYEKFGDTKSALEFLNQAKVQDPNPELETKIKRIETFDSSNKKFYLR